ncbi:hypothetical protein BpHYR1_038030 [Brachionus plicatilis]|uniref:RNA-directed DNA polymerase from mobile element jockey-like n=1 Tax=Brachionus plicatilis TaxID=10195 RepID=A0A3M7R6X0_BRAPC|nr:hypothetical protein BpHYR1_038030 [Brachionus plicatilis]
MKISVEKSCSVVFSRIVSQREIKFLGIKFDSNRINLRLFISLLKFILENNIKKLQAIQNTAVRSILKLKYDTPSNIMHHEAFNKLKLLTVSKRLFELSERYVGTGLSHSIPLVLRQVKEYKEGFESRHIEYPTPLCNCYLTISSYFPETLTIQTCATCNNLFQFKRRRFRRHSLKS